MTTQTNKTLATAAFLFAAVAGCTTQKDADKNWQDPFFPPQHEVAPTRAIMERQFAAGAVEDGTLYPIHFDGATVNSLGDQKLRAMAAGRPAATPLRVYLDLASASTTQPTSRPADGLTDARRASVARVLESLGVTRYDVTVGRNADAMLPAEGGVRALQSIDGPAPAAAAPVAH